MPLFPQQPPFPIDAVFTWVDGADPAWLEQKCLLRQKYFGNSDAPDNADNAARFRDNDELRYALRSLARHAPWIRSVHLVTADQKPPWLNTNTVNLVSHRDIFPADAALPVFNSHPIELCVHRVPGLAEHFIYFNDDVMLGRPVSPADFFLPDGRPLLWVVRRGKKSMERVLSRAGNAMSRGSIVAHAHAMIRKRYGVSPPYTMRHFPRAMTRSSAFSLWQAFPDEIASTLRSPFRSPADVAVVVLHALYALAEGLGQARLINGVNQILDIVSGRGMAHVGASNGDSNACGKMRLIRLFRPRTFCLNDAPGASESDRQAVNDFLAAMFPEPCKYELPKT